MDQGIPTIITRTAEMDKDAKKFGGRRYRFDPGRKNSTMFLATGTYPGSTHKPERWFGAFCKGEDKLISTRSTGGQNHLFVI